jgi:methylated-DNA-[protein]-cysteine S-methyltransferase
LFLDNDDTYEKDAHPLLQLCHQQLDEYFRGSRKNFDLPFNQAGTTLQQKVWELLYKIPFGKTISYQQLSKQYGDPKAIRAIASANGRNNLPIIVPCHRVIGSNQTLVGYSGGLWRKRWLLEHEAKLHSGVQELF